jgi:Photosynthetic reaction centre cytochrome C subunit
MEPMRLLLALVFLVSLCAQQPPPPDAGKQKRPPPEPKNLKILKVQPEQILPIMQSFRTALGGVQCTHCHVQGDFASDENPKKEIARHMIAMAMEINGKFPDGKMHVSCFTCHRGDITPKIAPEPKPAAPPAQ